MAITTPTPENRYNQVPWLTRLPAELKVWIINLGILDTSDVKSLRLTAKCFDKIALLWLFWQVVTSPLETDMERLRQIVATPRIAWAVKSLVFYGLPRSLNITSYLEELSVKEFRLKYRKYHANQLQDDSEIQEILNAGRSSITINSITRNSSGLYIGGDEFFGMVAKLGNLTEVSSRPMPEERVLLSGPQPLTKGMLMGSDKAMEATGYDEADGFVEVLSHVIAVTKNTIRKLSWEDSRIRAPFMQALPIAAFDGLESITLALSRSQPGDFNLLEDIFASTPDGHRLTDCLTRAAHKVRHLSIRIAGPDYGVVEEEETELEEAIAACFTKDDCALETLRWERFFGETYDVVGLLDLLRANCKTLKTITLVRLALNASELRELGNITFDKLETVQILSEQHTLKLDALLRKTLLGIRHDGPKEWIQHETMAGEKLWYIPADLLARFIKTGKEYDWIRLMEVPSAINLIFQDREAWGNEYVFATCCCGDIICDCRRITPGHPGGDLAKWFTHEAERSGYLTKKDFIKPPYEELPWEDEAEGDSQ